MFCRKFKYAHILSVAFIASLFWAPQIAFAQEQSDENSEENHWTVGVGAYGVSSPYDKNGKEQGAFPYIAFRNSWISIDPSGIALKALSQDSCKLELLAAPRFMISEPSDVKKYADMDRDIGLDLGARAGCQFGSGFASSVAYKADVSGKSKGHEVDVSLTKNFMVTERIGIDLKGGTYWRDNDLSRYLYGVFDNEARSGRPSYAPGSNFVPYAGVTLSLGITKHLTAAASFETEIYTKKIKKSPIIDTEAIGSGTVSIFYSF